MHQKILGTLYGQAVGDSLGIAHEFKSSATILETDPDGPTHYKHVHRASLGETYAPGQTSDDTAQANILIDSWLACHTIQPDDIALRLDHWLRTDGNGCGAHTRAVLTHERFLTAPLQAAFEVWQKNGSAANGAVMRTSGVGLFKPNDLEWTAMAASLAAQVTHPDPRCIASAVAVSVAIAALVSGKSIPVALAAAIHYTDHIHPEVTGWLKERSLESLELDKRPAIGFTYRTLGAGFWALQRVEAEGFLPVLQQIIRAGGDTDTNGCVAGALMGAALGYEAIPLYLRTELLDHAAIESRAIQLGAKVVTP